MAKYEPTSFFFTDYSALSAPTAVDAFGPVAGNLTTQYRTTSFVNGSGKLYAICDGQLLIQPQTGSTSKVNLILKPGKSYNGPKVKYFVYRNVNMSDLINGNNLVDKNDSDPNQPDIIKRIWKEFLDFNMPFYNQGIISTPPDTIPAIQIGYGQQPATTLIDHVFTYKNETDVYQIPSCAKGEFIGNFTGKIGLDVVLDYGDYELTNQDELFRLDLAFARAHVHVFDTTNPTINTPVKIKQYREHILQFMDAAALWGSHINCGTIETVHGDKKTAVEIGSDILSKYFTKDKVYVYIQGENDRSYNYYDTVRKVYGFNPSGEIAHTNEWPILIKQFSIAGTTDDKDFTFDYSIHPDVPTRLRRIIYDVFAANKNDIKYYPKIRRPSGTSGTTTPIKIRFYGNAAQSCATFLFLNVIVKQNFPMVDYFNSLWSVNIEPSFSLPSNVESAIYWANYNHGRLVNLEDTIGAAARIQNKVIFDNGLNKTTQLRKKRRLYLAILEANSQHNNELNVTEVTSGSSLVIRNHYDYLNTIYYKSPQEKKNNYSVYKGIFNDSGSINSLCLFHKQDYQKKNSYYQLGISEEEYNKLVFDNPAPITSTPQILPKDAQNVQFYLKEDTTFTHNHIRKFEVGLWFEDNTGVRSENNAIYPSVVNKVYIYTLDGLFFFTKDYSDHHEYFEKFAKSAVHFRPIVVQKTVSQQMKDTWEGNFGFDWIRIGDTLMSNDNTNASYDLITGKYYDSNNQTIELSPDETTGSTIFKSLKKEVLKASNAFPFFPTELSDTYFTGEWLGLYPAIDKNNNNIPFPKQTSSGQLKCLTEAEIDLYISIEVSPKSLKLTFEKEFLDIEFPANDFTLLPDTFDYIENRTFKNIEINNKSTTPTNLPRMLKVKIKALKEFVDNKEIKVVALEDFDGYSERIAGSLLVQPNEKQYRKEMNIVFVNVITNLPNRPNSGDRQGMPSGNIVQYQHTENIITSFLNQALIDIKKISMVTLDVRPASATTSYQPTANQYMSYDSSGKFHYNRSFINKALHNDFLNFNNTNIQYNEDFILFFVNEGERPTSGDYGQAEGISQIANKATIFANGFDDTTSAHELLHAVGLYHSFNNSGVFTTTQNLTDNILDYSDLAPTPLSLVALWKKQWEILIKHNLINTET